MSLVSVAAPTSRSGSPTGPALSVVSPPSPVKAALAPHSPVGRGLRVYHDSGIPRHPHVTQSPATPRAPTPKSLGPRQDSGTSVHHHLADVVASRFEAKLAAVMCTSDQTDFNKLQTMGLEMAASAATSGNHAPLQAKVVEQLFHKMCIEHIRSSAGATPNWKRLQADLDRMAEYIYTHSAGEVPDWTKLRERLTGRKGLQAELDRTIEASGPAAGTVESTRLQDELDAKPLEPGAGTLAEEKGAPESVVDLRVLRRISRDAMGYAYQSLSPSLKRQFKAVARSAGPSESPLTASRVTVGKL